MDNTNKIYAFMIFWSDTQEDSTRLRNVQYCWPKLKQLCEHINQTLSSHKMVCSLFDFSPEKMIDDAVHIPYPPKLFKKAEKLNKIIFQYANIEQPTHLMMVDSDVFFERNSFTDMSMVVRSVHNYDIVTFDLAKLETFDMTQEFIDKVNTNWLFAYGGEKHNGPFGVGCKGGLGGVYIIDYNLIYQVGGYNEKYTVWGGEDGEIMSRIYENKRHLNILAETRFYPFHLPHFCDYANTDYWSPGKNLQALNDNIQ